MVVVTDVAVVVVRDVAVVVVGVTTVVVARVAAVVIARVVVVEKDVVAAVVVAVNSHTIQLPEFQPTRSICVVTHRIDTGDSPPIKQPPRRLSFALRHQLCQLMEDMLVRGVITHSLSPWASPVVLVAKRDGSTRVCVNYRRLNAVMKQDVFPLPRIDLPAGWHQILQFVRLNFRALASWYGT